MPELDLYDLEETVLSTLSAEYSLSLSAIDGGVISNSCSVFRLIIENAEQARAGIIDVGCGSIFSTDARRKPKDDPYSRQFEPWLLRMLEITGRIEPELRGKLLGIDLMKQGDEKFPWIASDLSKEPNALQGLSKESFGIVNNTMFAAQTAEFGAISPTLYQSVQGNRRAIVQIHANLIGHAKRLLVPGGFYIENANLLTKNSLGQQDDGLCS